MIGMAREKKKKRKYELGPMPENILRGFWRFVLRIHYGIPGGVGIVSEDGQQFTGGQKDLQVSWPLAGSTMGTLPLIDSIRPAGEYLFGSEWHAIYRRISMGMGDQGLLDFLIAEYGMIPPHVIAGQPAPKWYKERKRGGRGRRLFEGLGQMEGGITWADTVEFIQQSDLSADADYAYQFVATGTPLNESVWQEGVEINTFFRTEEASFYGSPGVYAVVVQSISPTAIHEIIVGRYENSDRALFANWMLTRWFYGIYDSLEELVNEAKGHYQRYY